MFYLVTYAATFSIGGTLISTSHMFPPQYLHFTSVFFGCYGGFGVVLLRCVFLISSSCIVDES